MGFELLGYSIPFRPRRLLLLRRAQIDACHARRRNLRATELLAKDNKYDIRLMISILLLLNVEWLTFFFAYFFYRIDRLEMVPRLHRRKIRMKMLMGEKLFSIRAGNYP